MTDMSSHAVTQRLRLMDELWLLSVKLMNSKVIIRNASASKKDRTVEMQNAIRKVLFYDWDPIGVSEDFGGGDDEYDSYIAPVYRILTGTRSEDEIVNRLHQFERDSMGGPTSNPEGLRLVAKKLLDLKLEKRL